MLKLKRLSVKKHPMLDCPVDLHFSDGENILVGINGSGKTTLLELINNAFSFDFSSYFESNTNIELDYTLLYNDDRINFHFKLTPGKHDNDTILYDMSHLKSSILNEAAQDYHLSISIKKEQVDLGIVLKNNKLTILVDEDIVEKKHIPLDIVKEKRLILLPRYLPSTIEVTSTNKSTKLGNYLYSLFQNRYDSIRFPEGLDYFKAEEQNSTIIFFEINKLKTATFTLPRYLSFYVERIDSGHFDGQFEHNLIIDSDDFPVLKKIYTELNFNSIKLDFNYKGKEKIEERGVAFTWQGFKVIIDIDEDTTITDDKLSYGEKRFISIMLYLEGCGDVIILDEPINGLHHNLIDRVVDEIYSGERQCFIANQNSTLFDYINFNSVDDVKEKLILCSKKDKKMHWRNLTDDEAKEFFAEVEVDFMHISEILRMKNLW